MSAISEKVLRHSKLPCLRSLLDRNRRNNQHVLLDGWVIGYLKIPSKNLLFCLLSYTDV